MALFIEIKAADGLVSRTILEPGTNRFTVRLGDSYRIFDDQTGLTPQGIAVKRVDNDLLVDGLGVADTTVEFAAFYSVCSAGSPCELTVDSSSGGAPVAITPGTQPIGALADGSFVLYDPRFAETAPPAPATGDGAMVRNVLYGVGGLAVVGLAAGGGGGGGGGDGDDGGGAAPGATLKFTSSPFVNSRTPTLTGEAEPGSRVLVRIDTDGDGAPNVTYGTTVGADSRWSVNLATAVPESGALPAGGLPDSSIVGITSTTNSGVVSLPPFTLAFDGVPPAPAVIDAVATDNVVNAAEKQNGFVISGTAETGSTVVLSLGAQVLATVAVQENGQWQTEALSSATLPADGAYVLSAVVQDRAGNLSTAAESSLSINTAPPLFTGLSVAGGDNIVAIRDAASVGFSGRTDPNAAVQVQWNGGDKPVIADAGGNWSLEYTGAEVPNSDGAAFPYSIIATNVIGNTIVQTGQVVVDRVAPAPPVINTVEGDNVVTVGERGDGVSVSGQGETGARVQVSWGSATRAVTVDPNGQWGTTFGAGDLPVASPPSLATTVTALQTDSAGNSSPPSGLAVTVEQPFAAPTIAVVAGDNIVNLVEANAGVVLSGSAPAGAAGVSVAWGAFQGPAAVSGGTWSISVPAAQVPPDGATNVTATLTGAGGGASAALPVTIDKTPPAAPIVMPVEGDDNISLVERLDGVIIQGQAELGATLSVAVAGAPVKTAAADGLGNWSALFTDAELPRGPDPAAFSVSAVDAAGNISLPTARLLTFEILAPASPAFISEGASASSSPGPSTSISSVLTDEVQS